MGDRVNWFEVAPTVLVTVGWLWLPGLPVALSLGLRGIAAFAVAPLVSTAVVASTAVLAEAAGVDWSVPVALVAAAVVALVVGVGAFLLRRREFLAARPDPRRLTAVAAVGLLVAVALAAFSVMRAVGPPDSLSQVFDTPFHYNALAYVHDAHRASSRSLGSRGNPEVPAVFYPAAWHDFGSLVMMSTGSSIPVTANVLCAAVTVLLWPASCLLLVRQLFGRDTAALAIAGVLSVAFPAAPWDLFGWGVLWPNLLGMALAPAAFALVLTLAGWVRDDAIGRPRAWLLLAVAAVAAGFAHPNVLFTLVALALFPVGAAVFLRARRLGNRRGVVECAAFVAVVLGGWLWSSTSPVFAGARNWDWAPIETPANAVGEVLLNATNHREALWLLSALVVIGACTARRFPALRWVLAAHLVSALLFVLAASLNRPDTRLLTGYWFNDSHRLAAMLPITAVPLAVAGVLAVATALRARVRAPQAAVAVALTALLAVVTGGLNPTDREGRISVTYPRVEAQKLVTDEMRAFYARIADDIPEDGRVIGNPFDGSVMLWALADREVVFPHFLVSADPDEAYLGQHLREAATDPEVCRALARQRVGHVLIGKQEPNTLGGRYGGIAGVQDAKGFELVDRSGESRLYRITACGPHR
ncbi:DUF6541 family protein [Actinosynnema sp. NPDC023658]|uniref:DUF6541 family protein n=1 Tax=Actinosynnema sp. NPDC023658 TaxID=3155465 RepID=UPI0033E970B5